MRIRSHLTRALDLTNRGNLAVVLLTLGAGGAGLALTVFADRDLFLAVSAGGSTFLTWALTRELDPDSQPTAVVAAIAGGAWALLAGSQVALLPFVALLFTARLLVETTGRRPLLSDLIAMAVLAAVVSFTPLGWVMGSGLAIALYVDDRLAIEHNRQALLAAMAAAVGSALVVTLTESLPGALPAVRPLLTAALGILALVAVVRDPPEPVSFVDSRRKAFLRADRLHAGRAATGLLVFVGALAAGEQGGVIMPMAVALASALVSSEVERLRRARSG